MSTQSHWVPLESNPDVLNEYAIKIGIKEIDDSKYNFTDVYGLDPDILHFVPAPCLAVLLLFPITEETEKLRKDEEERCLHANASDTKPPYFLKQTIRNACGTIALLHVALNLYSQNIVHASPASFLQNFYIATKDLSPQERGIYLENTAVSLAEIHAHSAQQGQTAPPDAESDVDLHFVAFIEDHGRLYELDGRKSCPIDHGEVACGGLLNATARVVKQNFLEKVQSLNFSLIALAGVGE